MSAKQKSSKTGLKKFVKAVLCYTKFTYIHMYSIGPAVLEEIGYRQTDRHPTAIYRRYIYILAASPLASSGFTVKWLSCFGEG